MRKDKTVDPVSSATSSLTLPNNMCKNKRQVTTFRSLYGHFQVQVQVFYFLNFTILSKCTNKFDSPIFEMFYIRDFKPKLNKQNNATVRNCLVSTPNSPHVLRFT